MLYRRTKWHLRMMKSGGESAIQTLNLTPGWIGPKILRGQTESAQKFTHSENGGNCARLRSLSP